MGYGASLRPGEYLPESPFDADRHVAVASVSVWFGSRAFGLDQPNEWPAIKPTCLQIHLNKRKNDQQGTSGAFVIPANPSSAPCLVQWILDFATLNHPLQHGRPLFEQPRFSATRKGFRKLLAEFADLIGLDRSRLVPHSLRYGVIVSMVSQGYSRDQQILRGGWLSESGPVSYWRQSQSAALEIAPAVYDRVSCTAQDLVGVYSSGTSAIQASRMIAALRQPRNESLTPNVEFRLVHRMGNTGIHDWGRF